VLCEGRRSRPVLPVHEVALSLGGAIVFQVQNALAATAAAWRLGVPVTAIAATLRDFTSSPTLMPGACNQVQLAGATVIVDRLSDPYSARALARGLRRVKGRHRRLVLLPATGDEGLDPPALVEIGRLMGRSFDLIVIYAPEEAPGRSPERPELERATTEASEAAESAEATACLRAGIALNPVPPVVLTVAEEGAALERVLRLLRPGDLALVLARDVALVLRTVLTYRPVDPVEADAGDEFLPTGGEPP
jgi:cyanophycin synthetase